MKIRISPGNRKMGQIPSISLPAVKTCGNVPCTKRCYVVRNMYGSPYGKTILASHQANLDLLLSDIDEYHLQLNRWITVNRPTMFRFHVSGDYISREHLDRTVSVVRAQPETHFLAFTKRHDLLPPLRDIPENFSLIASMWPGWGKRPRGYRAAWVQDGTENRIPGTAIHCQGNCETCGMCWDLRKLRRDVWFEEH